MRWWWCGLYDRVIGWRRAWRKVGLACSEIEETEEAVREWSVSWCYDLCRVPACGGWIAAVATGYDEARCSCRKEDEEALRPRADAEKTLRSL